MAFHLLVWAGARPDGMLRWLALVITYAVHAAVWASAAALLSRRRQASPSMRNLYFKLALFGPLLSALAAALVPSRADGARVSAPERGVSLAAFADVPVAVPLLHPSAGASSGSTLVLGASDPSVLHRRSHLVALAAAGAAGFGLLRFFGLLLVARRRLRARRVVSDARMIERLEGVRARSRLERVALSEDSDVATPLVLGQQEICIPLLTLGELSDAELDTVLAHEIAHLERGDGFWFPAVGLVEAVLWFNPLNHWAARRFRESAELACDDRAVGLTGDPLGLARALVQVAEGSPRARRLALAPTMFRSASALVPRVRRLTGVRFMPDSRVVARGRRFALGSFGVLGAVVATLSVQVVDARPEAARAPARVTAADTVPPDPAEASERIAEALNRERELEHELAAAAAMRGAEDDRTPAGVRMLELTQALRHTRETALWLERSFVEREASFEAQRAAVTVR